ncbi:MAG: peptide ABC transporter substrate-binding protein [Spirochaetia bacterium]
MHAFLLIFSFLITVSAYGQSSAVEANIPTGEDETVFSVIFPQETIELDPHRVNTTIGAQLHSSIYEGLVILNPKSLMPEPALAESWEINKEGTEYTFTLRRDSMFSDGTPIDAYSFYRAFLRLIDPNSPKEYAYLLDAVRGVSLYRQKKGGSISTLGLQVLNRYTLRIRLQYPVPYFLSLMAHHAFVPISSYQLPGMWNDYTRVAYSGPYLISEQTQTTLKLRRNPFYWDLSNVGFKNILINISADAAKNTQEFDDGQADWVLGPFDPKSLKKRAAMKVNPSFSTHFFYFSSPHRAFADPRVREALFLLIPWDELRSLYRTPALGLVPPLPKSLGYNSFRGLRTNKKKARKLLHRAGYPGGRGLPELEIATSHIHDQAAKLIASAWLELDTTVRVHVPEGDYFEYLAHNTPTLASYGWVADYLDPIAFLSLFASRNQLNRSIYKDADYDKFLFSSNLRRGQSRMRILSDAENILLNNYVIVPISHPPATSLIDLTIVQGWYDNPLDLHPFKYLSFGLTDDIKKTMIGRFAGYDQ